MNRRVFAGLLAVLCVVPIAPAAEAKEAKEHLASITWRPCPEDRAVACGTLRLPVDWTDPSGPAFELVLVRRAATDPARRIGSLFVNPGGPGGSGVSYALAAPARFSAELLSRFDIIGIDPRGVARSHPVVCSAEALAGPGDSILPGNQTEFEQLAAYNRRLAADCRRHTGPLYDHVDSVAVARDIDAVRAALGEEKITWYGASYGSLMGQMYAELFPHRIRAMVNDGNMDHSLSKWPFLLTEASFAEDSYQQFANWCDRSINCALHGEDIDAVVSGLLAKADAGTLVDPSDGHTVSSWELLDITQFFFGRPRWVELADWWRSFSTGATASAAVGTAVRMARPKAAKRGGLVEDVRVHFCQDWSVPVRDHTELDRMWQASRRIAPRMRTSLLAFVAITQCIGWPGRVNNPQHRLEVSGAPTILMLNGLHDPATGYLWARNAARQLGTAAVLVTYEGAGHTAYRRNSCTLGITDRYLVDLTVPPDGTRCPASDPALTGSAQRAGMVEIPGAVGRW